MQNIVNNVTKAKCRVTSMAFMAILGLTILSGCGDKPDTSSTDSAQQAETPVDAKASVPDSSVVEDESASQKVALEPVDKPEPNHDGKVVATVVEADKQVAENSVQNQEDVIAEDKSADTTIVETDAAVKNATEAPSLEADAGKKLYDTNCHVCHNNGLLDAPKIGDKDAWVPRIAKGVDVLHKHSAEGFGKMPPQVSPNISEAQVYAAVDYIIEQSS